MLQVRSMLKRNIAVALLTAACVAPSADAQQPPTPAAGTPAAAPAATPPAPVVVSPEVLPDARVVFRLYGPQATEVAVQGVVRGRVPMVEGGKRCVGSDRWPADSRRVSVQLRRPRRADSRSAQSGDERNDHRLQQPPGRTRLGDDGHQERPARSVGAGVLRLHRAWTSEPDARLHAARLRRDERSLSGLLSAARFRRLRPVVVGARPRRHHPRQPDRGAEGEADGAGHARGPHGGAGQPRHRARRSSKNS